MNHAPDNDHLRQVALFSPMCPAVRRAMAAAGEVLAVAKGHVVDVRGQDALIVLLSGAVALSVQETDRQAILSTVRRPQALNLACVMARAGCPIRWRALEATSVLILPGAIFRSALADDASLAARAFGELAEAYQQLLSGAAGQRLQTAQRRVADYLLSLVSARRGKAMVQLPYEKHLLASLLGMTPENFSRALGRLSEHGVSVRGADIDITKVERLRAALIGM
ncbi:MAG: helix-turn-helix domain-containing protein [bacterium]|nr:helix-turn-helix domain-containing protein [bacterium]